MSQQQSLKSRNTQKTRTAYPPLPESILEETMSKAHTQRPPSPVDRQTNKSPSIAPSDSVTEAYYKRERAKAAAAAQEASQKPPKSVKSSTHVNGGEQSQRGVLAVLLYKSSGRKLIGHRLRHIFSSLSSSHVTSLTGGADVPALTSSTHV